MLLNVCSKHLQEKIQSRNGCICLIFLHCAFSNVPSNSPSPRGCILYSHIGCTLGFHLQIVDRSCWLSYAQQLLSILQGRGNHLQKVRLLHLLHISYLFITISHQLGTAHGVAQFYDGLPPCPELQLTQSLSLFNLYICPMLRKYNWGQVIHKRASEMHVAPRILPLGAAHF